MGLPGGSNAELSCNILVVRFRCPGTVVWVSPLEICTWNRPGQLLCAVQLEETKTVVPVRVPNFDLRFDLESAWFPSKGMVSGPGLDRKALKRAAFVGEADMTCQKWLTMDLTKLKLKRNIRMAMDSMHPFASLSTPFAAVSFPASRVSLIGHRPAIGTTQL